MIFLKAKRIEIFSASKSHEANIFYCPRDVFAFSSKKFFMEEMRKFLQGKFYSERLDGRLESFSFNGNKFPFQY